MSMKPEFVRELHAKLETLQAELETLGFSLDRRGSREAADVANTVGARVGELRAEFFGAPSDDCAASVRNVPVRSLNQ
ncbi:MAG TPA: hypothetical protein VIM44_08195 [Rariglobus sp.]